jgi:hypothetical protein
MSSQPSRRGFLAWLIALLFGSYTASLKAESVAKAAVPVPVEPKVYSYQDTVVSRVTELRYDWEGRLISVKEFRGA